MKYDFLIVGAGLYGSVFAHRLGQKGLKCLVIDKRHHVGGNVYTENVDGIHVHKYGAHIFHTNQENVWTYMNSLCKFNNYINSPLAHYKGRVYNLPFNMNTFSKIWDITTPEEAKDIIQAQIKESSIKNPSNLEEMAISLVGKDIYEMFIKHYTLKQWDRDPKELPAFIIKRLPVRYTYDNNYFNDRYQGIPIGGYTAIIEKMLSQADVKLNTNFFKEKENFLKDCKQVLYTGKIDAYYNYCYGHLEYRSLTFEEKQLDCENFQGNAVVNYTDSTTPYTRIIEHKHFEKVKTKTTVISYEYPKEYKLGETAYYPINDKKNSALYRKYKSLADKEDSTLFGGRLAEYKYYNMDQIVHSALNAVDKIR